MASTPFRGRIPGDRLYDVEHDMWVRREEGAVRVGATAFGIHRAGEIIGFTAKPKGAEVERGRGLATVECAKTVLAVRTPVSGTVLDTNEAAEEAPAMLNRDPYEVGWMARLLPASWDAESAFLVDAVAYRAHVTRVEPGAEIKP